MKDVVDDVYGPVTLASKLLVELLESKAIQRLKDVSQAGASSLVRKGRDVTRYEHSVGVMNLVGILGGSDVEQAAGLLQDVSHTAFSHTVDYVFGDRKEEFHERIFEAVIEKSDLPQILKRYGLSWQTLFSAQNLVRVDAPSPLLCADRIDYTLRDLIRFGRVSVTEARAFVASLEFRDGVVVSTDEDLAWSFVQWYHFLVSEIFMNPLELYAHDELARIIRNGLKSGVLEESDLLETDQVVIAKLLSDKLHGSADAFEKFRHTSEVEVSNTKKARRVYSKARIIDPPVLHKGEVIPLSTLRTEVEHLALEIRKKASDGILVAPMG